MTDRKELDSQIEDVFGNTGDKVRRARSGSDLMAALADPTDRVVCSLVHKFGKREESEMAELIADIQNAKHRRAGWRLLRFHRRGAPDPVGQARPCNAANPARSHVHRLHRHAAC